MIGWTSSTIRCMIGQHSQSSTKCKSSRTSKPSLGMKVSLAGQPVCHSGDLDLQQTCSHKSFTASPNLRFVAQIPESDLGEQLVAQWIGCIANQSWFFKYGRVQLSLIVRPTLYDVPRFSAQISSLFCELNTSSLSD